MYYFFLAINCLFIILLGYLLLFSPAEFSTGAGQYVTGLALFTLAGVLLLTVVSLYLRSVKHLYSLAGILLALSWVLVIIAAFIFLSKQKWM